LVSIRKNQRFQFLKPTQAYSFLVKLVKKKMNTIHLEIEKNYTRAIILAEQQRAINSQPVLLSGLSV